MKPRAITDLPGVHWVDDYHEGRAWFMRYDPLLGNLYGFMDRKQRVVVAPIFGKLTAYSEGLAAFRSAEPGSKGWGFIDRRGRVVISPQFYDVTDGFKGGLCAVLRTGESHYGYIDKKGVFAIKPQFTLAFPFGDRRAKVALDGQFYFIDKRGRIVTQAICSYRGV